MMKNMLRGNVWKAMKGFFAVTAVKIMARLIHISVLLVPNHTIISDWGYPYYL